MIKSYNIPSSEDEVKIMTIPYSNAVMFIVSNSDQMGTIVKIERVGSFDSKSSFDVSVVHGYNDECDYYESLAGIFADSLFSAQKGKQGSGNSLQGLDLVFISFGFTKSSWKSSHFIKEISTVLQKFVSEILPKQSPSELPLEEF